VLDTIGAGATATTTTDWHDIWLRSSEASALQEQIAQIHADCHSRPAIEAQRCTQFATSWFYQAAVLTKRNFVAYWRNPMYLIAKIMLNIMSGLLIGFSFSHAKDTLEGMQNKLFVCFFVAAPSAGRALMSVQAIFMSVLICVPASQHLQAVYIDIRSIYEVRERPSRMYTWTALVTSQILVEIPWNILSSLLCFICWYWTVGFSTDRAGYTCFLFGIMFPLYYTTMAQAIASMAPSTEIASVIFGTLFSFVIFV